MQYTIESRELTAHHSHAGESRRLTIEAEDDSDALIRFVRDEKSDLVSVTRPGNGAGGSIATVKKEDAVFLVRVYAA